MLSLSGQRPSMHRRRRRGHRHGYDAFSCAIQLRGGRRRQFERRVPACRKFRRVSEAADDAVAASRPASPLDPNQFTQELVQFSSVEQQIQTNTSLSTLISLQQNAQVTSALGFLGHTVVISGTTAQLTNGTATWNYSLNKPATATINISDSTGKVVYSTTQGVSPGQQTFTWNGQTSNGNVLSSGSYKISITATDANGQSVAVATQTGRCQRSRRQSVAAGADRQRPELPAEPDSADRELIES